MKGPPPQPTVLKMLRGNPGKRRLNDREPQPDALSELTPRELRHDPVAHAEWLRTIRPAIKRGQVTQADRTVAIGHCILYSIWQDQLTTAAKHPHVVAVGKGNHPVPNPARVMSNKTYLLLLKTDAELGLTPSSRSRVHVNEAVAGSQNPLNRYLHKLQA